MPYFKHSQMHKITFVLLIILFTISITSKAQQKNDTLQITLKEAQNQFIKNNIQLLTQKFSIDSAKAIVITAKLFDNPEFSYSNGLYNSNTKRFFDLSRDNWEASSQVSQLIRTARKRNKAVQLARIGVQITEYQFYDLLRTLRFSLRNNFYNMYYLQQSEKVYTKEIESLQKTTSAFEEQVQKGNIALKELLRIKSQLYTLQAELVNLQDQIDDVQSEFKLLLRAKATVYIEPISDLKLDQKNVVSILTYQTLMDSAYNNRYDLKIANANLLYFQQNLRLQKALAVPDINLGLSYDRLGSYVKNFNSIGITIPLPLFNRNQGNIKQAQAMIESGKLQLEGQQDQLESQVANSYLEALRTEKLLNSFDPKFPSDFDYLIGEVFKNFEKRNLTLLEFIDFYDSYKQNVLQLNNLRYNRISALEQLNYTTGTPLFNN